MSFADDKYQVLPQFVDPNQVALCRSAILGVEATGAMEPDTMVPGSPAGSDNVLLQRLHTHLLPKMEKVTGKRLFKTFVRYRVYRRGAVLYKHKDRYACEYSITLNLGGASDVDWPIFVESRGRDVPVLLKPGDAMLYKGIEVLHWREAYTGDEQVQAFLQYVDQDGPYAAYKDDAKPHETQLDGARP